MYYIVFDLEFNQDQPIAQEDATGSDAVVPAKRMPFEIVQFGALKLDSSFHTAGTFSRFVKPTLYTAVSPFITELTGIRTEQLAAEADFPAVYEDFIQFIGKDEAILCVWGKSDIKELHRNADYHDLNQRRLPRRYLNIQPHASLHLGIPRTKLLRLKYTVEALGIPLAHEFHDAYHDAYYTAEILKRIYHPSMEIDIYEPQLAFSFSRPRIPKKVPDFEQLIRQFEKMFDRTMTEEEQKMIKLSYQMGKTRQFLKEI